LNALRNKAKSLGTYYVEGEVEDFGFKVDTSIMVEEDPNKEYEGINSVKVCMVLYLHIYLLIFDTCYILIINYKIIKAMVFNFLGKIKRW